jgi:flagellar motor switch/type III secretory pathway protein FliN
VDAVTFTTDDRSVQVAIRPESALVVAAVERVLQQLPALPRADHPLDTVQQGVAAALALEVGRRVGLRRPLRIDATAFETSDLHLAVDVFVDERPYAVGMWVVVSPLLGAVEPRLSDLPVTLEAVAGASLGRLGELATLGRGDGWFPGSTGWQVTLTNGTLAGGGWLCAANSEDGIPVEYSPDGSVVVSARGGMPGGLPWDAGEETAMDTSDPAFTDTILDAPVIVRIEVASVTLTARQWAELAPGDVVQTAAPVGQAVTLRAAGRAIAQGELVSVDGELGVRILQIPGAQSQ